MCRDINHGGRRCAAGQAVNSATRRVTRLEASLARDDLTPARREMLQRRLLDALDRLRVAWDNVNSPVNVPSHLVRTGAEFAHAYPEYRFTFHIEFNPNRVKPVTNRERSIALHPDRRSWDHGAPMKPHGGMWFSPTDRYDEGDEENPPCSKWAWRMGCYDDFKMGVVHKVEFATDARVIVINSLADYRALIDSCGRDVPDTFEGPTRRGIDYERLPADALFITSATLSEDSDARNGTWDPRARDFVVTDEDADRYENPGVWDLTSGVVLNQRAITVSVIEPPQRAGDAA